MNAPNKSGWKPSAPLAGDTESATFTGMGIQPCQRNPWIF